MSMATTKQYSLPITGMTCANCVSTVERNLKKLPGVETAQVNLSSERASVNFDPAQASLQDMLARLRRAGYDLATGEADLPIAELSDGSDARRLEKLLREQDGVLDVQVNLSSQQARVRYVPTIASYADLRRVAQAAGF